MDVTWIGVSAWLDSRWLLLTIASIALLLVSIVSMPLVVARIPADYFVHRHRTKRNVHMRGHRFATVGAILKNALGMLLLCAGDAGAGAADHVVGADGVELSR